MTAAATGTGGGVTGVGAAGPDFTGTDTGMGVGVGAAGPDVTDVTGIGVVAIGSGATGTPTGVTGTCGTATGVVASVGAADDVAAGSGTRAGVTGIATAGLPGWTGMGTRGVGTTTMRAQMPHIG